MNSDGSDGRYDEQCENILYEQKAEMVLLLIVDGKNGDGMSCCINAQNPHAMDMAKATPELLRKMADAIDKMGEFKEGTPKLIRKERMDKTWSDIANEKTGDD